ncbi:MAG TPA: hypothetical protein VJL34_13940 [Anaerolineales bacterium]|nr:hypothetical protein [Anaerolineales bacterium]
MTGSRAGLVKIRLMAGHGKITEVADKLVGVLEGAGYEVIEWTSPFPCRPPEDDKSRVYISAVPNNPGPQEEG